MHGFGLDPKKIPARLKDYSAARSKMAKDRDWDCWGEEESEA